MLKIWNGNQTINATKINQWSDKSPRNTNTTTTTFQGVRFWLPSPYLFFAHKNTEEAAKTFFHTESGDFFDHWIFKFAAEFFIGFFSVFLFYLTFYSSAFISANTFHFSGSRFFRTWRILAGNGRHSLTGRSLFSQDVFTPSSHIFGIF